MEVCFFWFSFSRRKCRNIALAENTDYVMKTGPKKYHPGKNQPVAILFKENIATVS